MSLMPRYIQIQCDDCSNWVETMQVKVDHARKYMKTLGWTTRRVDGKTIDICKNCRKDKKP